jgi:UDP-3-O-[3-hydroxymyristoyl] glucosamine N-acyltransferase
MIFASIADDTKFGKDAYIGQSIVIKSGAEIGGNAKIFLKKYIYK